MTDEYFEERPSRLNFALIIVEVVRLLMDVLDWYERRKNPEGDRPMPQTFEVYEAKCYNCDQATGAYVSPTGTLMPPVFCHTCAHQESETPDEPSQL